ncbi:MAG: response regulator [Alphaproteobacteria bacterium]|nr:response regulator [Alphaproteobacteria bacterium]
MINSNAINIQNHKYMKMAVDLMGIICVLIGLFTMVMWKIHRVDLLVYMGSTMFFNTALCFFFSGVALLFLETRFSSIAKILGVIIVLFSAAVLSQDIFHINLGIDELFEDFYYQLPGAIPGRMAIQTSVNFILSGIALTVLSDKKLTRLKILAGLILSSLVLVISLMAIFGYFLHLTQSYGWQLVNPISINTAITFLFLGFGLILYAIWKSIHTRILIANYVHYIIFISIVFGAFLLYQALISQTHHILPEIILGIGVLFAFFLSFSFRSNLIAYNRAQELQKIQVNLMMAQEIANLGGWVWDLRENKINFTPQALKLLGLDVNQRTLPADQFFYLIHPNETENLKNAIATMKSGRSGYSEIYTFIRPDKETRQIRFSAEVSAFFNHFPIEISGILQDVTKLKILEEELHQSQKLELIGQLTGGIAHDFNNILMIIQGNLELLSFMMDQESKEYKKIETALTACARGSALTKRLLAFARQKTLNPEVFDIKSYMENFSHILQPTLGESIEGSIEIEPILAKIKVDPNQLESALLNLIVNARDAIGQGGKVKIKVDNISSEQTELMKKNKIPFGSYVHISISDSGSGIPPELMKHIFEPFFTTKPPNKGTGLGLSMVKSFVEQSQGYITLSSDVGAGTTIDLYFPTFAHKEEQGLELQSATEKDFLKGGETILVTEDEEEVRVTAVEFLKNLEYTVLEAQNGDKAYEILRKNKIDLLFTDVVMPGSLSGAMLAEKAIKLYPSLKILYTSGYPEKVKGNGHILSPLIIKPYKLMDLAVTIKNLLQKSNSDK